MPNRTIAIPLLGDSLLVVLVYGFAVVRGLNTITLVVVYSTSRVYKGGTTEEDRVVEPPASREIGSRK